MSISCIVPSKLTFVSPLPEFSFLQGSQSSRSNHRTQGLWIPECRRLSSGQSPCLVPELVFFQQEPRHRRRADVNAPRCQCGTAPRLQQADWLGHWAGLAGTKDLV